MPEPNPQQKEAPLVLLARGHTLGWKGKCFLCESESDHMTAHLLFTRKRERPSPVLERLRGIGPDQDWPVCKSCETTIVRLAERTSPIIRLAVKEF